MDTVPPTITDVSFTVVDQGSVADVIVELTISETLDENYVSPYPFQIYSLDGQGGNQWYGPDDIIYDASQNRIWVTFYDVPPSRYLFEVDTTYVYALADLAGNVIDAAGTGQSYSVLLVPFDVDLDPQLSPITTLSPIGAGISALRAESVAGHIGDADEFTLDLEAGALLSLQAKPTLGSGQLRLELLDPNGNVIATANASSDGETKLLNQLTTLAGPYRVRVTSLNALGRYQVDVVLGAAFETEVSGGANDTAATAESPQAAPRVLAGTATTTAVVGHIGTETRLAELEEIGFIEDFYDLPLALTPASAGGEVIGNSDFLLTTGYDLFAVNLDGSHEFLTSLEHYAQAMVINGNQLLTVNYSTQLLTVDPATGGTTSVVNMSRSDGLSLYTVRSMARTSDGRILVIFEGAALEGNALGELNPTTGVITPIGSLGQHFSGLAIDHQDRVFLELPPANYDHPGELHRVELNGSLQTSLVHRYTQGESYYSALAFTAGGTLFRATGPLEDSGGGGVEISGWGELDVAGSELSTSAAATIYSGGWQRLEFEDILDLADVYEVSLDAGQWLSLAVAGGATPQPIAVELLDPSGNLIAASTVVGSTSVIEGYVAPATGTYLARLTYSGSSTDYRLIISRAANLAIARGRQSQPVPPSGVIYGRTGVGARIDDTVAIDQPATFPRTVFASDYRWDIQTSGLINDGTSDAFDGGMSLGGFNAPGNGLQDGTGQSFRVGPGSVSGLITTRSIYVPQHETFARFIDTFTNTTNSTISTTISYSTNLGSDGGTVVVATQSGDTMVDTTDRWIFTDDSSSTAGDPSVGHLFFGEGSLAPSEINRFTDTIIWSYDLTVAPGETVSLMGSSGILVG